MTGTMRLNLCAAGDTMSERKPITVVTGGNRGIGFEICRQLASRGAQIVLTARSAAGGGIHDEAHICGPKPERDWATR